MSNGRAHFVSTKEESGFADPLGECASDFNILTYLQSSDASLDSPPIRYTSNGVVSNTHYPQAAANRVAVGGHHVAPSSHQQQRHVQIAQPSAPPTQNGAGRLLDSPPITNESSGSSSSSSPFSPEHPYYNYVINGQMPVGSVLIAATPGDGRGSSGTASDHMSVTHHSQISPNADYVFPPQTPISQVSTGYILASDGTTYPVDPSTTYIMDDDSGASTGDYAPPTIGQKRRRLHVEPPPQLVRSEVAAALTAGGQQHSPLDPPPPSSSVSPLETPDGIGFEEADETARAIKFVPFAPTAALYDEHRNELPPLKMTLIADKGFNYSQPDGCHINQKKNHFQITVLIKATNEIAPAFVQTANNELAPVRGFKLVFTGVKSELPSSEIQIRQSTSDRKPIPYDGVNINIAPRNLFKICVPRLHFSETTANNFRKNGRPNADQRFFLLVVRLLAETPDGYVIVQAHASDRVIVRASNPGQFESSDNDVMWQKSGNTTFYSGGPVVIGSDRPIGDAQLTVHGNIVSTGQHTRPSDRRVKEDIFDVDTREAMERIANVRVVSYAYKEPIARTWGLNEDDRHRIGVIAQELAEVIPDAVKQNGEFLTVDDTRIFYDVVASAQQLHQMTQNLEGKLDQVEKISEKLARYAQNRKRLGSTTSGLSDLTMLMNARRAASAAASSTEGCGGGDIEPDEDETKSESGDVDRKAALAQSRLSIVSTAPSAIGSASQYCRYYNSGGGGGRGKKRRSSRDDATPQLCSSRLTQATMVGLVAIMSICLLTMCTLYVLDWYNRTYVYSAHAFSHPVQIGDQDKGVANIVTEVDWSPPVQPLVVPLLAGCRGGDSLCREYCCPRSTLNNSRLVATTGASPRSALARASSTPPPTTKSLGSGVVFELQPLNATLDTRYCVGNSCNERTGRYTLYIPLSIYMPTLSLQLRVTASEDLVVEECGPVSKFEHRQCAADESGIEPHEQVDVTPSMAKLSAMRFVQSAYRLRVGYTTQSCAMSDEQLGRSFTEYNLVFYRSCPTALTA